MFVRYAGKKCLQLAIPYLRYFIFSVDGKEATKAASISNNYIHAFAGINLHHELIKAFTSIGKDMLARYEKESTIATKK